MSLEMNKAGAENLITQHLDTWTQAIETKSTAGRGSSNKLNLLGIQKLRELILEMAVRGLLVPQDPNDEPASVLLEKIAAEKAQLIKDKKIKKTKALPEIGEDEKPFDLPTGWEWIRLADFCEIGPRNKDVADDKEVSFIPMTLISTSLDGSHSSELKKWAEIKKGFTHFADGDIAIAKITPSFENSKAAVFSGLINGVGAGTTELHVARPYTNLVLSRYSLLVVKTPNFLTIGESKMTGSAGQKRVPKDFFAHYAFGLPPKEEQKRIVEKVDELMALCDQLESQTLDSIAIHQSLVETLLGNLVNPDNTANFDQAWSLISQNFDVLFTTEHSIDTLKQTILQLAVMGKLVPQNPNDEPASELLKKIAAEKAQLIKDKKIKKTKPLPEITEAEKPFDLPCGWEWVRLQDLLSKIGAGSTPSGGQKAYVDEGIKFLRSQNVWNDGLNLLGVALIPESIHEKMSGTQVQAGDLLFNITGASIGRCALVPEDFDTANVSQHVTIVRSIDKEIKAFLHIILISKHVQQTVMDVQVGVSREGLSISKLGAFLIPVPPKAEQQRIVAKVNELMTLCDQLKTQMQAAQQTQIHLAKSIAQETLQ